MSGTLDAAPPLPATTAAPGGRALFAQRRFVTFWLGQTVSRVGDGAYQVALGWTVYRLTGSTAAMGTLMALNFLPQVVFALVGGAVADRLPRRTVIVAADSVAAAVVCALALLAAADRLTLPLMLAAAVLLGTVTAFYGPAYAAMNRDVLDDEEFRKANSVFTATGNLARLAGPLLAAVAFGAGGASLVLGLNAASFAFSAVAMAVLEPVPRRAAQPSGGVRRELAEGLRHTRANPWIGVVVAVSLAANIACLAPYTVLLPALVRRAHGGVGTLGLLSAAEIGTVLLASLAIGRARRIRARAALFGLAAAIGAGTALMGVLGGHRAVLFAAVVLVGAGLSFDIIENTLLQKLVPEHLLSRVYSVNMTLSYSLLPLGYLLAGILARRVGAPAVLLGGGVLLLALCACAALTPAARRLDAIHC
ncbi:MFS transporter [Streptomyces sp. NPDC021224]|uniref:MFS transporter n=1 Tax=unclassified Streptomyces TaxID=2593676 RepID=UPI003790D53E